ncbi:MAG: hypothetical protein J6J54_01715, partial [Bacteroidales bacterium]|nr:hypothetical protein [Bacteroidales bacterium]
LGAICKPLSGQLCGLCRRMGSDPLNGGKMAPLSGLPCRISYTKAFLSLNGFADVRLGTSFFVDYLVLNRTMRASSRRMKRKVHTRPVMSPWLT